MHITIAILLDLLNLVFLLSIIVGLPGTWLMVAATALVAWWQRDADMFSVWTLVAIAALALVGELVEFLSGLMGAAKAGGGWRGSLAALLGGLVGGVAGTFFLPLPLIGSLVGACLGAAIGAGAVARMRGQAQHQTVQIAYGAGMGRFMGTILKLAFGLAIWIVISVASFWP